MPRRLLAALFVSLLAAPAAAQHVLASPPGPRTFGPDRRATGAPFTGAGITTPGLSCDDPPPPTALTCSGFLPGGLDGTLLEAVVRVPRTPAPHPLVVAIHGWGGSAGSMSRYDEPLTAAGYAVLRYSARGFGASWGQTNLADVAVEGEDLRSLTGLVVDDTRFGIDPGAVAVFGASYGGAHAWLGALQPSFQSPGARTITVRTVIPVATWSDLLNALVPNGLPEQAQDVTGAEKLSFVQALYLGGIRTRFDRPYPNYPEYLLEWDVTMTTQEVPYAATPTGQQIVDGLQGYRSIYWQETFWDRVTANHAAGAPQLPIFLVQGWTDDLFPAGEALRMYDALRAIDPAYPVALYLGDVGHPRAVNKAGEVQRLLGQVVAWLDAFVKGSGAAPAFDVQAAITRPAATPFDPADVIRVPRYAELATGLAVHAFGGLRVITFDPLNLSGFQWDPLLLLACGQLDPCPPSPPPDAIPGDVAVYTVSAGALRGGAPFLVAGEPVVSLWLATYAHREQLDVRLVDVAPGGVASLVTRGTLTLDTGSPGLPLGFRRVSIPTWGNLWEVAPDHTLRVEITNVDSPYLRPSLLPSVTLLGGVQLSLPTRTR